MIVNIHCRGYNGFLDQGDLDQQIIYDLETYLIDRKNYQTEHLDKRIKDKSHHYEEWTKENQKVITYTERLLECVKAQTNQK